ncbi:hypothetical protein LP123_03850 [Moraxella bovis]|uniref:hypothetical protein n=1 Tax=Moraxella bovis TaxID=476 RepID=UPI000DC768A4|nr:hypothetical protein [Moraxella bovis]AWY19715.1 hypothetical protein DQF64_03845 [Moraxella bovis]UYZ80506.1 hypothetical protein LP113_10755 [Moraxella bovis]UZA05567.1 hypothetical protein LP099_10465 [Moraxella bovis]UZA12204.1 hypothetical protein LP123_03850 [Moraxella bovis]UZA25110.1 hypothetical protein LP117_01170 [Moraxella bovis]
MNQVTYPTNKILYTYAILSGLVGGVIIGLFALVGEPDGIKVIPAYIDAVLFIGFIGIFVGFIPETATGYLITKFKLYKNFRHFISIKLIGFMISAIYVFLFIFFTGELLLQDIYYILTLMGFMGLLGALSAFIIGWFVLLKSVIENKGNL